MRNVERQRDENTDTEQSASRLLGIVREVLLELHPGRERRVRIALTSRLDRDLGFDSLARVELLLRINRAFNVELSETALNEADTPQDLLSAVLASRPAGAALQTPYQTLTGAPLGEPSDLPDDARTLMDVLRWHAERHPQRVHVLLYEEGPDPIEITYGALERDARRVAAAIQQLGAKPGNNIALMLPTGRDYLNTFFGVLLAGCVPVPIYPPTRPSQVEDHLRRHARMLANARTPILVTVREARQVARLLRAQVPDLRRVVTPTELTGDATALIVHERRADDTAFLQYTSGSTGDPKGVVLTHTHLLANIRAMGDSLHATAEDDVFVSWLPLYHDMGLIGAWLGSQYYAVPLVLMAPTAFLTNPLRWLRAIHRHRGTLSAAPNFAYELCVRRLTDDDLAGLDLSSWRVAANGAEPVSPQTVRAFCDRFERYGLRRSALMPVYGLAEAAVGLAFPPVARGHVIDVIRRDPFLRTGEAIPASNGESTLEFVACGSPLPGYGIRIVDDGDRELPDRHQGRVQFIGPSATAGYFQNADATRRLYHGDWLDTGDLGYLAGGDLYLTSRAKDLIIRGGRNLHPHELEETVGQLDGVRAGCVAAFGVRTDGATTERLVLVAETRESDPAHKEAIRRRIADASIDVLGMAPDDIVMVPPQSVLKTSSGKIRRSAVRDLYQAGQLGAAPPPVWRQFARLFVASGFAKTRDWRVRAARWLYAAYVHACFWLLAPLGYLLVMATPGRERRWRVARALSRLLVRATGIPLTTEGLDAVPRDGPCVIVANHASYIDGLVLMAVLPRPVRFVAKVELARQAVAGTFLRRLGAVFVERFDWRAGARDAERIVAHAKSGDALLYFPEGTFTRESGLMSFKLGAFMAAAEAGAPVVPVAVAGTRSILRAGSGFPHRHPLRIDAGAPIRPGGSGWQSATQLRDQARAHILGHIDEPDLAARQ